MEVGELLISWYNNYKRDLPWRKTKEPYKIWISEIILQQTRVEQGLSYYLRFIERFPNVESLAKAEEDDVLKLWQGLGYYSRARNLHFSAKFIYNELNNAFPSTYNELLQLKGVGEYTAAAIASFAYNEKVALVDGNVYRLLSRLFAEATPIDSTKGKQLFKKIAEELLKPFRAEEFNQAIMEFGAIQCKPASPDCEGCILNAKCEAFIKNNVDSYPFKTKKIRIRKRYLNYFFITVNESVLLRKRNKEDIWKGLYEPLLIETEAKYTINELVKTKEWQELFEGRTIKIHEGASVVHKLTHQQLIVDFYRISINNDIGCFIKQGYMKIPVDRINGYAVPKIIELELTNLFNKS